MSGMAWFTLLLIAGTFLAVAGSFIAAHAATEADYTLAWCRERLGTMEVTLKDKTRVDCLTATHAVEFDYAPKWAEAIGQALHYGRMTGMRAGIVLIAGPDEQRFVERTKSIIAGSCLQVDLWTVPR
jgi:hypothetical protein